MQQPASVRAWTEAPGNNHPLHSTFTICEAGLTPSTRPPAAVPAGSVRHAPLFSLPPSGVRPLCPRKDPRPGFSPREDSLATRSPHRCQWLAAGCWAGGWPRSRTVEDYNSQAAPRRRRTRHSGFARGRGGSSAGGGRGRGWGRPGGRCRGWGPLGCPELEEAEGRATPSWGGRPWARHPRPARRSSPGMRSRGPPVELRGVRGAGKGAASCPRPRPPPAGPGRNSGTKRPGLLGALTLERDQ